MTFRHPTTIPDLYLAFKIIHPISNLYPDFSNWYWDKVVPGIILNNDKIIIAEKKSKLVGISIIKNGNEKKLRTLRISEEFQNKGYGLYLIDQSLKELNTDKPIVSVAEEMINDFSRIFINRYNFEITHVYNGLYRKHKLEYEFNGNKKLNNKTILF
jgi:hypothetical protein